MKSGPTSTPTPVATHPKAITPTNAIARDRDGEADDQVADHVEPIEQQGLLQPEEHLVEAIAQHLHLRGLDLRGEPRGLVGDELREAAADAGNRRGVVGDHRVPESDQEDEAHQIRELDRAAAVRAGQGGLDAEPTHDDDREGAEHGHARARRRSWNDASAARRPPRRSR